jgi:hypothetical protein
MSTRLINGESSIPQLKSVALPTQNRHLHKNYSSQDLQGYHSEWSKKANKREKSASSGRKFAVGVLLGITGVAALIGGKELLKNYAPTLHNEAVKEATPHILETHQTKYQVRPGDTVDGIDLKVAHEAHAEDTIDIRDEQFEVMNDPRNQKAFADGHIDPGETIFVHSYDK